MRALGDLGEAGAEVDRVAALGEPAVERGIDERAQLGRAEDLAGDADLALAGHELRLGLERRHGIAFDRGERLGAEGVEVGPGRHRA